MYAEERHDALVALAHRDGRVSVAAAAKQFGVTPETIRRDLQALETAGQVRRVHGGAVPRGALTGTEADVTTREVTEVRNKDAIAHAVARKIPAGATLILDAGTTTARVINELCTIDSLTVITHAPALALALSQHTNLNVHLIGGRLRPATGAAVGSGTVQTYASLRADVAVVGANGITVEHGVSTTDPDEADVKRAIVSAGQVVIVAADSTKLGHDKLARFATLSNLDILVTDTGARDHLDHNTELTEQLAHHGVEVVLA